MAVCLLTAITVMLFALATPNVALAQPRVGATSEGDVHRAENVFLPAPRAITRYLSRARKLLDERRYGEAVRLLGEVLETENDYFFQPDRDEPIHRSLKAEAQRLLGSVPKDGRELYQLQHGPRARTLLQAATEEGSLRALADVSRRFFHTEAGYEATFLLGMQQMDQGRPLEAALTLSRLRAAVSNERFEPALSLALAVCWLRAEEPQRAREVIVDLKRRYADRQITLGGQPVRWFNADTSATDWLSAIAGQPWEQATSRSPAGWTMVGGNPARNASVDGGMPLMRVRWRVPTVIDPAAEEFLRNWREVTSRRDIQLMPSFAPLVVGDIIVMRTMRSLLGVDARTGKMVWEASVDDGWHFPAAAMLESDKAPTRDNAAAEQLVQLMHRMAGDTTYGTLSSDGRLVFAIDSIDAQLPTRQVIRRGRVQGEGDQSVNRLSAYEIKTDGKLKWHVGGSVDDEFPLRQAGTFFLGPPLPLRDRLYVLAESKGEISLRVLNAADGELLWSQPLAVVEPTEFTWSRKRYAALSPAYADGILVCPTGAGAVAAVDLATRALLWGYRYEQSPGGQRYIPPFAGVLQHYVYPHSMQRWVDSPPRIVGGRVLLTPTSSDYLLCLDLTTGKLLWRVEREEATMIGCVAGETILLVGSRVLQARRLEDGAPAWQRRSLELPGEATATGLGFLSDGTYYLPLSTGEIAAIDVEQGRVEATASSRGELVPGHLVCHGDLILSQSFDALVAFDRREPLAKRVHDRLRENPDDPWALMLRAELRVADGELEQALADLRRAHRLEPSARSRAALRDVLLDGLASDFPRFVEHLDKLKPLLQTQHERAQFHRLIADGYHEAGEWRAALDAYLAFLELAGDDTEMEQIGSGHLVRSDRWVRTRLERLRARVDDETRTSLDAYITERVDQALKSNDVALLRGVAALFGNHPAMKPIEDRLIRRAVEKRRALEAELLLLERCGPSPTTDSALAQSALVQDDDAAPSLEESAEETAEESAGRRAAEATLALAEMLERTGHPHDAAVAFRILRDRFGDVPCDGETTGAERFAQLPADHPARDDPSHDWPIGQVLVKEGKPQRTNVMRRFHLAMRDHPGPFLRHVKIWADASRRSLLATDGLGRQQWKVTIDPRQMFNLSMNSESRPTAVCGHLVVIGLGAQVVAIDSLGPHSEDARVLWTRNVADDRFGLEALAGGGIGLVPVPAQFGQLLIRRTSHRGEQVEVGPVTPRYVAVARGQSLLALDPLTGEPLWARSDLPEDADHVFGDRDYVIVAFDGSDRMCVYRALDGELVARPRVPHPGMPECTKNMFGQPIPGGFGGNGGTQFRQNNAGTLGRRVIFVGQTMAGKLVGLYDPIDEQFVWGPRVAPLGEVDILGHEQLAVHGRMAHFGEGGNIDVDHRHQIMSLADGRMIVDASFEPNASGLRGKNHTVRMDDTYLILAIADASIERDELHRGPVPGSHHSMQIGQGMLFAYGADGQALWDEPVPIENRFIVADQPEMLPVFTFANIAHKRLENNRREISSELLCIDKRTGHVVLDREIREPMSTFALVGEPDGDKVHIRTGRRDIELHLTDRPLAEKPAPKTTTTAARTEKPSGASDKPAAEAQQKPKKPSAARALLKIIGGGLGK